MDKNYVLRELEVELRKAFMLSGPIPIFDISEYSDGEFLVSGISEFKTHETPVIPRPNVSVEDLMSMEFQKVFAERLKKSPVVLEGRSDVSFPLADNKEAVIYNVEWRVEVYKINRMEMDDLGDLSVFDFNFRGKAPLDEGVDKWL